LDAEAWDRLITWIDLNTPFHGTWTETGINPGRQRQRRRDLRKAYAGVDEDPESLASVSSPVVEPLPPHPPKETDTETRQPVLHVTLQPDARPKGIAADLLLAWTYTTPKQRVRQATRKARDELDIDPEKPNPRLV